MRKNENLVRSCDKCEYYEVGCEDNCPFELEAETVERPTLRSRRKNMKAEKAGAYEKALHKLNTAENKAEVATDYEKPKDNRIKDIDKEIKQLEDMHTCKMGEPSDAYPKPVFRARAEAIKQAKRELRRQNKKK